MVRHLFIAVLAVLMVSSSAFAQIGKRSPSEKKVVNDPVTGIPLTFLTSGPSGDNTLYQTHQGWTADRKWIVFRSGDRAPGQGAQAFAVNEESGVIVQLTEGPGNGFGSGALNVAQKSMKLYYTRNVNAAANAAAAAAAPPPAPDEARGRGDRGAAGAVAGAPATQPGRRGGRGGGGGGGPTGVYELDLAKLFADSEAGTLKPRAAYERLCGQLGPGMGSGGGFGLDANEEIAYLAVRGGDVGQGQGANAPLKIEVTLADGARGTGMSGIRSMNLKTGEIKFIADIPFQVGHLQANPFNPGEIIYCWETGGKAPTRAWVINADGTNNRPVFAEAPNDWVTHETVVSKDEVAIGILGHRRVGSQGTPAGTREHPTGVAVVNLRTKEMMIEGQTPTGSVWHVNGSWDRRWLTADDFQRSIWLWDRNSMQRNLISTGHRTTAADHPHPIFDPTSTKILVQSAMIAADETAHDLCVIPIPKAWLARTYSDKAPE